MKLYSKLFGIATRVVYVNICFVLLILSCTQESKNRILEPELFAKIYTEIVLLSLNSTDGDSLQRLDLSLKKFNVSPEDFESTKIYIENNPEIWLDVLTMIEEELKKIEAEKKNGIPEKKKMSPPPLM